MTQELHVRFLGQFSLALADGEFVGAHTARLQSLLAYLLLHRDAPLSRQRLAFLFWPDTSEAQAQTNLRQLLHTLRHRLPHPEAYLELTAKTIRWRGDAPFTLDVADFDSQLALARQTDGSVRLGALERAVASYGGELLPGCYDDWLLVERAQLAQRFLHTLHQLILLLEQRREYGRAIGYAERLLREDPFDEESYRLLMRLHALNANRAGALRIYHVCAATLEREFGARPSSQTLALYHRLLEQVTPVAPTLAPSGNGHSLGRTNEWRALKNSWRRLEKRRSLRLSLRRCRDTQDAAG